MRSWKTPAGLIILFCFYLVLSIFIIVIAFFFCTASMATYIHLTTMSVVHHTSDHPHHHHHQKKLGVSYPPHPRRIHTTCTNASSSECVDPSPNPIISKSGLDVTTCDDLLHTPSSVSFPSISSVPFISSSSSSLTSQDASSAALQWTQEAENGIEKVDFLLFKISPFYFSCNVIDSDIYTHTYTYT